MLPRDRRFRQNLAMGEPHEWTVVTWNVHGSSGPPTRRLADVLEQLAPDVVAIQEVRWHQAFLLARRLRMRRRWALKHFPYTPLLFWLAEGAAVITPHQITRPGARIVSHGSTVWTYRRRIAQWATIVRGHPADRDELAVFNVHLSPGDLADERRAEAGTVTELATRHGDGVPLVVAGDFNDADDPTVIAALPGVELERPPFTNPSEAPNQRLDHVLVPVDAVHLETMVPDGGEDWVRLSDHLPVTVRFRLATSSFSSRRPRPL